MPHRPTACLLGVAVALASRWAAAQDLELALHGGGFVVTDPDEQLAPVGLVGGVTPLLRLSSHFAVGMKLEYARLGWDALGASEYVEPGMMFPNPGGAYRSTMIAGVGRVVILSAAGFEPYAQVALGHLAFREDPDHPDCHFKSLSIPQTSSHPKRRPRVAPCRVSHTRAVRREAVPAGAE